MKKCIEIYLTYNELHTSSRLQLNPGVNSIYFQTRHTEIIIK